MRETSEQPWTSPRLRVVWIVLAFTALTVAFTWPLARHLADAVPGDPGDPLLNASILGWDADRLRHGLRGFWDAPIFFPYHRTLAFSEHLLGIAIFVAPLLWATGNPLVAYNIAFLASFMLAGAGMFLLVRELTGRESAAWIAALIFAFTPARVGHINHLQVLMSGWMPLALWALHRFVAATSAASLVALIGFFLAQSLSNNYFIYFLTLPAAIIAIHSLAEVDAHRRRRIVGGLILAATLIVAALAPIAVQYFRVRHEFGFIRSMEEVTNFGADLATYLHGDEVVRHPLTLWRSLPFVFKPAGSEGQLFMGGAALALAVVAVVLGIRRGRDPDFRHARVYAVIAAAGLMLSLGANPTAWGVRLPIGGIYRALFELLPGFDGLRVPARLAVVVQLGVAVLAGISVSWFVRSCSRPIGWAVIGVLSIVIFLEGFGAPLPLAAIGRAGRIDRGAYDWIREHASGPLLELPAGDSSPLLQAYVYDYQTLFHRQRIVNGASGYDSALDSYLGGTSSPLFDSPRFSEGAKLLRAIGVLTVVVHPRAYVDPDVARDALVAWKAEPHVVEHVAFPDVEIFRLAPFSDRERPERAAEQEGRNLTGMVKEIPAASFVATASASPDRLPFAFDHDIDTRWLTPIHQQAGEFVSLAFDHPRDIARVRFLTSARSFGDYPRQLAIQSVGDSGISELLFEGPVAFQLGLGLTRDPAHGPIDIWLPPNRTRQLRLVLTASTRRWLWAIDELSVWESQ